MKVNYIKISRSASIRKQSSSAERVNNALHLIRIVLLGIVMVTITSCSKNMEYEIVSQQSHSPLKNKIVISQVIQSPDRKLIATVGEDNGVRIWNSRSHALVRAINDTKAEIHAIHFLAYNKLVIITKVLTISVYDLATGRLVFKPLDLDYKVKTPSLRPSHIRGRLLRRRSYKADPLKVKFSRTGRFVAIYTPSYLKVIDLVKNKVIKEFDKNKVHIRLFDFTWSGENLVYATRLRKLEYFSLKTMSVYKQSKVIALLRYPRIRDISLIYNNTHIVVTGWGRRQLKIWNLSKNQSSRLRNRRYRRNRTSSYYQFRSLTRFFEPGKMYIDKMNNLIVLFKKSGEVMTLDFRKNKKVTRLKFKNTILHSVVTSRDGSKLLLASQQTLKGGHAFLVADRKTGQVNFAQTNIFTHATAFLVQVKNNVLYSAHFNGSIHQWQLDSGRHIATFRVGIPGISRLYMLKGKKTLMGIAAGRKLFSYDLVASKLTRLIYLNSMSLKSIGLDFAANRFLTGYSEYCFKSWSLETWRLNYDDKPLCRRGAKRKNNKVQNIIYNKAHKSTILSYGDVNVKIYPDSRQNVSTFLLAGKVKQIRLGGNGKTLAAVIDPDYLYVWKLPSFKILKKIKLNGEFKNIQSLAYSHNDKYIYVGTANGTLLKYNVNSGTEIYRQTKRGGSISLLTEGSRGKYVITGHLDNTIRVRDSKSGELNYVIEVLPNEQWIIYRPGVLPIVASKTASKYFRLRDKSSLHFYPEILNHKGAYIKQLPRLKASPTSGKR